MTIGVLGISFHTAPVALREQASVNTGEVPAALARIRAEFPAGELVLLSTCNRTELYTGGINVDAHKRRLIQILLKADARLHPDELEKHFYVKSGPEATEHLLAVASGLDAMVVGETEILGQVKRALGMAEDCRTLGGLLHPLFQNAFRIAKRVHTETDICRGRVSVSSLAVEFAEKVFDELASKTIMLVGAGETAELALKSLIDRGARDILVLNRSLERGQALAERCGGRALPFDLLDDYLPRADMVISSTGAPHLVISAAAVQRAIGVRNGRPMLMVDIAVPRDIDPAAARIKDVYVYSIDDLQRIADKNLARRRQEVDRAWAIVREGAAEIAPSPETNGLRQLLRQFDEHGRAIGDTAVRRTLALEKLADLPEPIRDEIEEMARRIVDKMLAEPRNALRKAAKNGDWETTARVVNDLFGFDKQEHKKG